MKTNFAIVEMDPEFPIVGVISDVSNDYLGHKAFNQRLIQACESHFDAECKLVSLDNIWEHGKTPAAEIWVEGGYGKVELKIYKTQIY
jgi:hypothetical protein